MPDMPMPDPSKVTIKEWYRELGRRGGSKGGKVAQSRRTKEQRVAHAKMMADASVASRRERARMVQVGTDGESSPATGQ